MPNPHRHARPGNERQPEGRGLAVSLMLVLPFLALSPAAAAPSDSGTLKAEQREPRQTGIEFLQQIGGASRAFAARGAYVYLAVGPRLVVLDVSNPTNPTQTGQSPPLPGVIWRLSLDESGSYAYAASNYSPAVHILDVSEPHAPTWISTFVVNPKPGGPEPVGSVGIRERGGLLYLAAGTNGLRVVDVRDPEAPVEIGHYWEAEAVNTVLPAGGVAYMHCNCDGWINKFRVLDISDLSNVTVIGEHERPVVPGVLVGNVLAVGVPGQRAVDFLDVSDPIHPKESGSVLFPYFPGSFSIMGNYLYVTQASPERRMEVVDIADPSEPRMIGSLMGVTGQLLPEGSHLYALAEDGLQVIDASVPERPSQVGRYPLFPTALGVRAAEGRAYVTGINFGLQIYDITDPFKPIALGSADRVQRVAGLASGYLVAVGNGLTIVDVSDPVRPVIVGSFGGPAPVSAATVAWPLVYAGDLYGGLTVFDVSDPTSPTPIASLPRGGGTTRALAVAGAFVYILTDVGNLRIIDVTNPIDPTESGSIGLGREGWGLAVDGSYAYVANGYAGLRIIDISDATAPTEVASYSTEGNARAVAVGVGHAYVADEQTGLLVIDVSDPSNPLEVASQHLTGALDVVLHGAEVLVAAREAGLSILRL